MCAVGVGLFRSDGTNKAAVGDVFTLMAWDITFMDEVYGVGAFDSVTHTLCKATEFISGGMAPCDFVFGVL